MPEGVDVIVDDGEATIEFVDQSKRGPGLAELFKHVADPADVEKRTRPNRYVVPESAARAAGLLDDSAESEPDVAEKPTYDDGVPDDDWRRDAINDWASKTLKLDVSGLPNKGEALTAIKDEVERRNAEEQGV